MSSPTLRAFTLAIGFSVFAMVFAPCCSAQNREPPVGSTYPCRACGHNGSMGTCYRDTPDTFTCRPGRAQESKPPCLACGCSLPTASNPSFYDRIVQWLFPTVWAQLIPQAQGPPQFPFGTYEAYKDNFHFGDKPTRYVQYCRLTRTIQGTRGSRVNYTADNLSFYRTLDVLMDNQGNIIGGSGLQNKIGESDIEFLRREPTTDGYPVLVYYVESTKETLKVHRNLVAQGSDPAQMYDVFYIPNGSNPNGSTQKILTEAWRFLIER